MSYDHRDAANAWAKEKSRQARDIAPLPAVKNKVRKYETSCSLAKFCKLYQPDLYDMPWSEAHLDIINCLEKAITGGGLFTFAMPRGTGKTTLSESATIWALITGYRRYVMLVSATEKHAQQSLENLKNELSTNELLLEDWPEVVYPIHKLERIARRSAGQIYNGEPTYLKWTGQQIMLPTIPGSKCSGSIIEVRGITGAIRGAKYNLPGGGGALRPELVLLDDPQTDESAGSIAQCETREDIIKGTILGLTGHQSKISAVMPCTVIRQKDLAWRFLSNDLHPEWESRSYRLLKRMPENKKLWDKYREIRTGGRAEADKFYLENKVELDAGAEPLWEQCSGDCHSAIQYAMELFYSVGERAFWAEYQNEPLDTSEEADALTVEGILRKINVYKRYQVPPNIQRLTMFVDVHKNLLYYMVAGWSEDFGGQVIDYGTWPEQDIGYFTMRSIDNTLGNVYPAGGSEASIMAGLNDIIGYKMDRNWGDGMHVELCLIDANWGAMTGLVYNCVDNSKHAARLLPSHGRFIGATSKPLNQYFKKVGDLSGDNWRVPKSSGRWEGRHVTFDSNYWKSFIQARIMTPPGDRSSLYLFSGKDHKLLADHWCAEYPVAVTARNRTVNEWKARPSNDDNHWFDCMVGCAVAASMRGSKLPVNNIGKVKRKRRKVRYF